MRQCTRCMAQNNDRAKYCSQCGYMLTPPQATNKGDKLAALSFIFAISGYACNLLVLIFTMLNSMSISDGLMNSQTVIPTAAYTLFALISSAGSAFIIASITLSFIATKKGTTKRGLAIAARIMSFSLIGIYVIGVLAMIYGIISYGMHLSY